MRARAWILALVSAAAAGDACSTFGASSPDDATDAGVDAPAPPAPDGAPLDGASEDAGRDAAVFDARGDADASSSCSSGGHLFCDDFDESTTVSSDWAVMQGDGGTVDVVSDADAPTPPNAVVASAKSVVTAAILRNVPLSGHGISCAFDVDVTARGPEAVLLTLDLDAPSSYYRVELRLRAAGDGINEYGVYPDGGSLDLHATAASFGSNAWKHVAVAMGFGAGAGLTISVDGTAVVSSPAYDLSAMPMPNGMTFTLGAATFAGAGATRVAVDDVVCDVIP